MADDANQIKNPKKINRVQLSDDIRKRVGDLMRATGCETFADLAHLAFAQLEMAQERCPRGWELVPTDPETGETNEAYNPWPNAS